MYATKTFFALALTAGIASSALAQSSEDGLDPLYDQEGKPKTMATGVAQSIGLCTTIVKSNLDPKNFPNRQITLSCPTGYTVVSGGAQCYDYENWYGSLTKSFPYGNGWAATCQHYSYNGKKNNEGAQIISNMYVRCCQ